MAIVSPIDRVLTAEEFARRADSGRPEELVRGKVVALSPPNRRHGQICGRVVGPLSAFVETHDLGHVLCDDAGIVTQRGPDTVRGADVAFYSFNRLARGPLAPGYGPEVPELVVEVKSPGDRWSEILARAAEYLAAGVSAVVVLDDASRCAQVFTPDAPVRTLVEDDTLELPEILPGFHAPLRRLYS